MPRTATVKRLTFPEGRRVLAISDIHGNLPFLKGVLAAAHYGPDDILVLVGDLVEKGPDSLTTLRFIMELAERNTVYCLRGNCDNLVSEFVAARGEEERFYRHYVDVWRDRCLLVQMGHAAGFETRGRRSCPLCGRWCGPASARAGLPGGHAEILLTPTTSSSTAAWPTRRTWRGWTPGSA
ncbi:MAG: metallophosphoesterase family protein [Evtepia gabavorous]